MTLSPRTTALLCALSAVATFAACWFGVMERAVTERSRERVVFLAAVSEQRASVDRTERTAARDVVTARRTARTTTPDGTVTELVDERIEDRAREVEVVERVRVETRTEVQYVDREVVRERIVTPAQPRWSVGASAGLDVRTLSPVYGVDGAWRALGPLWLAAGVQVSQTDPRPIVTVGARWTF